MECDKLVSPLFELLAAALSLEGSLSTPLEHLKQLILTAILHIVEYSKIGSILEESCNVELVVQCIRMSHSPQTHNQALLLLAAVTQGFPTRVLRSVMPIFTFMGANVLQQDDGYSFQVMKQTISAIIPALIQVGPPRNQLERDSDTSTHHMLALALSSVWS